MQNKKNTVLTTDNDGSISRDAANQAIPLLNKLNISRMELDNEGLELGNQDRAVNICRNKASILDVFWRGASYGVLTPVDSPA